MLQNATPLMKSAPWPPNISDEHVSCTAPATRNTSLQTLFKCPRPAIIFETATKPSRFAHFWQGAESLVPATQHGIRTSKSAPYPSAFSLLTSKCASCHDGVHYFDMSTSKSAPWPSVFNIFVHFWLWNVLRATTASTIMTYQLRKWSEHGVLSTCWLGNVLRATAACTFSTSQFPKVVRRWCALCILTSTCASRHNGVQFFISHLARLLRTRRFSAPTFRPSGATNYWKNTVFRDFPTFSRTWIFFLLTVSSLILFLLLFSSLLLLFPYLLSSVHIVGSLTSKLPSNST